jgi:5-carboxymethyl-2-hydroxymuconate isomerase
LSTVICFEEAGELRCEREEDRARRELEERIMKHIEAKLKELIEQHELEITVNVQEGKGVGKWRKKQR